MRAFDHTQSAEQVAVTPLCLTHPRIDELIPVPPNPGSRTESEQGEVVVFKAYDGDPRADTRVLACHLELEHRSVFALVREHRADFEELGVLRFEIAKPTPGSVGGRPSQFALLCEDQAFLLLTFSRNTPRVRSLKLRLVKAFGEARRRRNLWDDEYLPSYRALHDEITELSQGSINERFVHMNVNKLINKIVGVESGQRATLTLGTHSLLVVAHTTAELAMRGAVDHRDGYARAKGALHRLRAIVVDAQCDDVRTTRRGLAAAHSAGDGLSQNPLTYG